VGGAVLLCAAALLPPLPCYCRLLDRRGGQWSRPGCVPKRASAAGLLGWVCTGAPYPSHTQNNTWAHTHALHRHLHPHLHTRTHTPTPAPTPPPPHTCTHTLPHSQPSTPHPPHLTVVPQDQALLGLLAVCICQPSTPLHETIIHTSTHTSTHTPTPTPTHPHMHTHTHPHPHTHTCTHAHAASPHLVVPHDQALLGRQVARALLQEVPHAVLTVLQLRAQRPQERLRHLVQLQLLLLLLLPLPLTLTLAPHGWGGHQLPQLLLPRHNALHAGSHGGHLCAQHVLRDQRVGVVWAIQRVRRQALARLLLLRWGRPNAGLNTSQSIISHVSLQDGLELVSAHQPSPCTSSAMSKDVTRTHTHTHLQICGPLSPG